MVAGVSLVNAAPQEADPIKRVPQRNDSDSSESNGGWESGDDDASTDLDLTDHSKEEEELLFGNSQEQSSPPIFAFMKRKDVGKLRNPWKKSSSSTEKQVIEGEETIKKEVPKKDKSKESSKSKKNLKSPVSVTKEDTGKKKRRTGVAKSFVKQASLRGKALIKQASVELIRSASKRFSRSSTERRTVLKTSQIEKALTSSKKERKSKSKSTKKATKHQALTIPNDDRIFREPMDVTNYQALAIIPKKDRIFREPIDVTNHRRSRATSLPIDRRQALKKVPSDMVRLWKRQSKQNTTLVLQWAVWETHVQSLVQPPDLAPWSSFRVPAIQKNLLTARANTENEECE